VKGAARDARPWELTHVATACGTEPDARAVIIAPLEQMIVTRFMVSPPSNRARPESLFLKKLVWRDGLPLAVLASQSPLVSPN